jgi:hypothetical protein
MECTDEGLNQIAMVLQPRNSKSGNLYMAAGSIGEKRGGGTKKPRVERGFAYAFRVIGEWVLKFTFG